MGAGPKGIAIAAKARALAAAGLPAPRVVLVDRSEVAGNWTGRQGYTSGLLPLGTPPEKDVGYPYAASWDDASADVVGAMAQYSWQRHLIRHGVYSDWVDRGRLRPTHREWSTYLREVAELAEAEIVRGVVTGLEITGGDRWEVTLEAGSAMTADGVVMTGAGPAITVPGQPRDHPRVLDGRTYRLAAHKLARERAVNVCVVGSGETAASVVIDLLKRCGRHSTIDVLATRGVLYSRGESYDENQFYSDPSDWPHLAEAHRREFLERTDRGVFSLQAEATLNQARGSRAARCTSRPTGPTAVSDASPVYTPIRTRTRSPAGHAWPSSACCIATVAARHARGEANAAKNPSPSVFSSRPSCAARTDRISA